MTKRKLTKEQSPGEKYDDFIGAFGSLHRAADSSRNLHSEDINARENSRAYAISYADENIEGLKGIAKNEVMQADVLKSDASIDRILRNAIHRYQVLSRDRFASNAGEIIQETPDKGLAAIVYGIPALKIEGNDKHNKAAYAHEAFYELASLAKSDEAEGNGEKRARHQDFYNALIPYVAEKIKKIFEEDEELKGKKELLEDTISASAFVLASSQSACMMTAKNFADKYKKEFDSYLPEENNKAEYARETLRAVSKDEKSRPGAMELVYDAHNTAKKKAA